MALFTQNMIELAMELAAYDPVYEDLVLKFGEHFVYIAAAMNKPGPDGMGTRRTVSTTISCGSRMAAATRLKVRSMVGLLPCAPRR